MLVQVARSAAARIRRGHPWVYREAIVRPPKGLASGTAVELVEEGGPFLGHGLWDAVSPIAVRIFVREQKTRIDERTLGHAIEQAIARRDALFSLDETTAYRLCNGEGDRVPGLVLDRYESVAVLRLDGDALRPWLDRMVPLLGPSLAKRGIATLALRKERGESDERGGRLETLAGPDPPEKVVVREHGMAMEVDLARGQKTGAFLDQRENRARVRAFAAGRGRVLNLFSYAGGFSVAAALGGAKRVTSVDTAAAAHASAQRSFRANDLDPAAHDFVAADAFDFLERSRARGERFDLVVSDPPSFAPSERARQRAMAAYRRLHGAIAAVLAEGALFCAASCSSHVHAEDFLTTLDDGALGRSDVRLLELHGQPADHPTLPAWPEGRYLKFAVLG